jgi:hypothetical protein
MLGNAANFLRDDREPAIYDSKKRIFERGQQPTPIRDRDNQIRGKDEVRPGGT